jgi:hypothetical protein
VPEEGIRVEDKRDLSARAAEKLQKPAEVIEMPVAQDNGFDHEKGGAKLPGIMEEAVTGEPGIKENRVLLFPGKETDETGETVLGKEHAARLKRSPVIYGTRLWYQVVGVIVDQNGNFYPVDRFYGVFRHSCTRSPDDAGIFFN